MLITHKFYSHIEYTVAGHANRKLYPNIKDISCHQFDGIKGLVCKAIKSLAWLGGIQFRPAPCILLGRVSSPLDKASAVSKEFEETFPPTRLHIKTSRRAYSRDEITSQ
jgi:hypothetical protein